MMQRTITRLCFLLAFVAAMEGRCVVGAPSPADDLMFLGSYTSQTTGMDFESTVTSHYHIGREKLPWDEARTSCKNLGQGGSDLIAIETGGENAAIRKLILNEYPHLLDEFIWTVGSYKHSYGSFRWLSTGAVAEIEGYGKWEQEGFPFPYTSENFRMTFKNSLFTKDTKWGTHGPNTNNLTYICETSTSG